MKFFQVHWIKSFDGMQVIPIQLLTFFKLSSGKKSNAVNLLLKWKCSCYNVRAFHATFIWSWKKPQENNKSMEQKSTKSQIKINQRMCSKCFNFEHLQPQKWPLLQYWPGLVSNPYETNSCNIMIDMPPNESRERSEFAQK